MKTIVLDGPYNDEITISEDSNIEYVFEIETNEYLYFFESSEPGYLRYSFNNPCPSKICVLQMNVGNHNDILHINYFRNLDKNVTIRITSVHNYNGYIQSIGPIGFYSNAIRTIPKNIILISEESVDYIYYFKTFDKSTKLLYAEYNETMTVSDIINKNEQYFREFDKELLIAQKDKIFIFSAELENPGKLINILILPKKGYDYLYIDSQTPLVNWYFSNDIPTYTIDFSYNKYDIMFHLSTSTRDTEISSYNYELFF